MRRALPWTTWNANVSHPIDATYDAYNETWRRARKEHACNACHRPIVIGERYARIFIRYGGIEVVVRCARCQTIHEHLRTLDPGESWPAERLNCGEEYREHWDRDPPELIAALAFATAAEAEQIRSVIHFRDAARSWFGRGARRVLRIDL